MPRPRRRRIINFEPDTTYFKPRGIPMRDLQEVCIAPDELQAIKLYDLDGLSQIEAAVSMGISQPTFARIIKQAHKKIAQGLIRGLAIRL
ncbi:MAG: DUF134 domain-containing protein [Patescibacteria group bacterium]|nr:DUF134 domain-containing protein [Patescibacteria group bacterium]